MFDSLNKRPYVAIKRDHSTHHYPASSNQYINKMVKKSLKVGIAALAVFAIALGIGVGVSEKNKRSRAASSSLATGLSEYEAYESIACIDAIDTANGKSGKSGPTAPSEGKSGKSGPTAPSAGKSGKSGNDPFRRMLIVPGTEDYKQKPVNRRLTGKSDKGPTSKAAKVIYWFFISLLYQDFHVLTSFELCLSIHRVVTQLSTVRVTNVVQERVASLIPES